PKERPPRPHSSIWARVSGLRQRAATKPMTVTRMKKKMKTLSAVPLISVVIAHAPIGDPGQESGDRHPCELVPVEERKAEESRLTEIEEGHPGEPDIGNDKQPAGRCSKLFIHVEIAFHCCGGAANPRHMTVQTYPPQASGQAYLP